MGDAVVSPQELHPAAAASREGRGGAVRDLFAGIARRYDLVNRVASGGIDLYWRRVAARELALREGDWCLDACCGTGDLSLALSRDGARVLGVDFCRPMLDEARAKRARPRAVGAAALAEGDAMRLPVATASMDAACVAFGLRNLADPAAGLAEMARVVRPGGKVAVLEFCRPRRSWVRVPYELYSSRVLPLVGDLLSGSRGTYRYLPQTIGSWHEPDALARLMADAGLEGVRYRLLTFGIVALHVGIVPAAPAPR